MSKDLIIHPGTQRIVLQCQVPPCTTNVLEPARTPLLCERHYAMDTRKGKFSPLMMWMALFWLAHHWKEEAKKAHEKGEDIDLTQFRAPVSVMQLTDLMIKGRKAFFAWFPRLGQEGDDAEYINEKFVYLTHKPQVHMVGIYLRMLDAFSGYPAVRVTSGRPKLTAYINQPPSWVEKNLERLKPFEFPSGHTILVVEHPWEQIAPKLEGSKE